MIRLKEALKRFKQRYLTRVGSSYETRKYCFEKAIRSVRSGEV